MKKPLKDLVSKKLTDIAGDITRSDRLAYIKKHGPISEGNLSLYLNGTVFDVEKALLMLKFFKKRIKNRKALATQILND